MTERDRGALKALQSKMSSHVSELTTLSSLSSCESVRELHRKRAKEMVSATFNKLGIVVPYNKKTELGYRPLPMSNSKYISHCSVPTSHQMFGDNCLDCMRE